MSEAPPTLPGAAAEVAAVVTRATLRRAAAKNADENVVMKLENAAVQPFAADEEEAVIEQPF